jgi:hypothetical protein
MWYLIARETISQAGKNVSESLTTEELLQAELMAAVIGHDRRRILHFNVSRHPMSSWIAQPLREAFPYDAVPEFMLFDHDAK